MNFANTFVSLYIMIFLNLLRNSIINYKYKNPSFLDYFKPVTEDTFREKINQNINDIKGDYKKFITEYLNNNWYIE
jgi:hypothetical protein